MRHLLFILSLSLPFILMGCDKLAPEERWSQPPPIVPQKNVLLLEYTGQRCVNCPNAAQQISQLQSGTVGHHLIAVAIHGGQLAENSNHSPLGLVTEDSEWLTKEARVQGWPCASIDGAALSLPPEWNASIAQQLAQTPQSTIYLTAHYDATSRQLTAQVTSFSSLADSHLSVFLVEDSIPSLQYLEGGKHKMDYLHRHVLRQILTPRAGITVSSVSSSPTQWQRSLTLPLAYGILATSSSLQAKYPQLMVHPERLHLVAFVAHRPTGRILEAQTVKVQNNPPTGQ